jgi:hypothetical protein
MVELFQIAVIGSSVLSFGLHGPEPLRFLVVVGVFIVLVYCLGPVLVWLTLRPRVPIWDVVDGDVLDQLRENTRDFFQAADRAFVQPGFSRVAVLHAQDLAPGVTTWIALYASSRERTRAVAQAHVPTHRLSRSGRGPIVVGAKPSVYFLTKFVDACVVETANSGHVSPFPAVEGKTFRQFPEIVDPKSLYKIHQSLTEPMGGTPRDFPAPGEEAASLANSLAGFYRTHVGTGYLQEVDPDWIYRPTVKGAILMTWKLLPPVSWVMRWRRSVHNRTLLAELGLLAESMGQET